MFEVEFCDIEGKLSRIEGPAVVWNDGSKYWCQNGEYHREDGPAVEYADGQYW